MTTKNFVMIGAAGFIAPRHMQAIKETGNRLIAILDKNDSIGVIDSYFPDADFFTEYERFDRHLEKLTREGTAIDYVVICSPNYLHDAHIRFALRHKADVICEKPLVLNPWNLDSLLEIEQEVNKRVYTILQLRLHPSIIAFKESIRSDKHYRIKLDYITGRGKWYHYSWKGDLAKSGGIATNIGVHFFDMLTWIFGVVKEMHVDFHQADRAKGQLIFANATVDWFLSINIDDLPATVKRNHKTTYRSITCDEKEIEFSDGFKDLHTESYKEILSGKGFGIEDSRSSINIIQQIRQLGKDKT